MGIQTAPVTDLSNQEAAPEIEADDLVRAIFPVVQTLGTTLQGMTTTEIIAQALSKYLFNSGAAAPNDSNKVEGRLRFYVKTDAPVTIYFHDGVLTNDWLEIGASGVPTPHPLRGRLLASVPVPVGTVDYSMSNENLVFPNWVVEPGVTEITTSDVPVNPNVGVTTPITNGRILVPRKRIEDTQLGWYVEVIKGETPVGDVLFDYGYVRYNPAILETDDDNIEFYVSYGSGGSDFPDITESSALLIVPQSSNYTIDAMDDYKINFHVAAN